MIVKLEQNLTQEDIEVLIRYAQMNKTVRRLASLVKTFNIAVKCKLDSRDVLVNVSDILYIESVDKRSFVYCDKEVYRTDLRLYQLIEEYSDCGLLQVSKSCLVNINMLKSIRPLMNSRLEATLKNDERINVTRKYVSGIRTKMQER